MYTRHDLSEDLLDTAYGMLVEFFNVTGRGQAALGRSRAPTARPGTPGLLVETAASSDQPDWKEMLNWATPIPPGHPLKRKFPTAYPDQVMPEETVPGITKVLYEFHDTIADLQRRFLRVIAEGIGCHETFFDDMVTDGPTLTRAIRYPPMTEVPDDGPSTSGPASTATSTSSPRCRGRRHRACRCASTTSGSTPWPPRARSSSTPGSCSSG